MPHLPETSLAYRATTRDDPDRTSKHALVPGRPLCLRLPVQVGHEAAQEGHEPRADVGTAGGQLDRGPQVVVLVAGVVAGPGEGAGQHAPLRAVDQALEGVGDLD